MLRLALLLTLFAAPAASQCVCLRCLIAPVEMFSIPASSMLPGIAPGDCVEARRYDDGDPVPQPGTLVVFDHPTQTGQYLKRVVALGGQRVQMRAGVLHVDGRPVALERIADYQQAPDPRALCPEGSAVAGCAIPRYRETLPNGASYEILDIRDSTLTDDTPVITVPPGHVFVMGDNRDNSVDSRMPPSVGGMGPVPLEAIVGIVED